MGCTILNFSLWDLIILSNILFGGIGPVQICGTRGARPNADSFSIRYVTDGKHINADHMFISIILSEHTAILSMSLPFIWC